jgi:hypothetical protein
MAKVYASVGENLLDDFNTHDNGFEKLLKSIASIARITAIAFCVRILFQIFEFLSYPSFSINDFSSTVISYLLPILLYTVVNIFQAIAFFNLRKSILIYLQFQDEITKKIVFQHVKMIVIVSLISVSIGFVSKVIIMFFRFF